MTQGQIFSIGHGGRTMSGMLEQLAAHKVEYVIDVRTSPYSRYQPDFIKDNLKIGLADGGVRYVYMGGLLGGRPTDSDCYTDGKVDYQKVRNKDFFLEGIERLKLAHSKGLAICLLCSESHPSHCHRAKLIGVELGLIGIDVHHMLPDGGLLGQGEVIESVKLGQDDLFSENFSSKKKYR